MSENKYPLIKKFLKGLKLRKAQCMSSGRVVDHISPSDLEAELAKGVEICGDTLPFDSKAPCDLEVGKCKNRSHTGLLIGYKKIEDESPVSVDEILKALENALTENKNGKIESVNKDLISRIKRNGVGK